MRTYRLAALPLLVAAIGCGSKQPADAYQPKPAAKVPAATITPGSEASLMPLDQGNQWTYSVEAEGRSETRPPQKVKFDLSWKVVSAKPVEGGTQATILVTRSGVEQDRQIWQSTKKGLFQVASGSPAVSYSSPQPVLLFPIKSGGSFSWKGSGPTALGTGTQTSNSIVLAMQEVDTEMGRFSAVPIESRSEAKAGKLSGKTMSTAWFSPGTGLVRFRQEALVANGASVLIMKLKSKSLRSSS